MIFYGGGVVSLRRLNLVFEGAEVDSFAVDADSGSPSLHLC